MAFVGPFLVGLGLGFSLAAPPGPIMAKMALDTSRGRWIQGALVGLGATTGDAVFFAFVYFGLLTVLPGPAVLAAMSLAGVALMDFFAFAAWRASREPMPPAPKGRANGFAGGFMLAITSPFNMAWWLTSGAPFVAIYGLSLALGFFVALVGVVLLSVALFWFGARRIERFERYVAYASAAALWLFGVLLAFNALRLVLA